MFTFSNILAEAVADDFLISPEGVATPFARRAQLAQRVFGMTPMEFQRKYNAPIESAFLSHGYMYVNHGVIQVESDTRSLTNDQIALVMEYLKLLPPELATELTIVEHDSQTYQLLHESQWYAGTPDGLRERMLSAPSMTTTPGHEFQSSDVQYQFVPQRGRRGPSTDKPVKTRPWAATPPTPSTVEKPETAVPKLSPIERRYNEYHTQKSERPPEEHEGYTVRDRRGVEDYEAWQREHQRNRRRSAVGLTFDALHAEADMAEFMQSQSAWKIGDRYMLKGDAGDEDALVEVIDSGLYTDMHDQYSDVYANMGINDLTPQTFVFISRAVGEWVGDWLDTEETLNRDVDNGQIRRV